MACGELSLVHTIKTCEPGSERAPQPAVRARFSKRCNKRAARGGKRFGPHRATTWVLLLLLPPAVVLRTVDGAAGSVLLTVDLHPLRGRQMPPVRGSIAVDLVLDLGFAPLQVCGLARGEGTILHAFRDPLLLASFAPIHFCSERGNGEGGDKG